jgi:hypothetical protein
MLFLLEPEVKRFRSDIEGLGSYNDFMVKDGYILDQCF